MLTMMVSTLCNTHGRTRRRTAREVARPHSAKIRPGFRLLVAEPPYSAAEKVKNSLAKKILEPLLSLATRWLKVWRIVESRAQRSSM